MHDREEEERFQTKKIIKKQRTTLTGVSMLVY
jgi:hypothetical protein